MKKLFPFLPILITSIVLGSCNNEKKEPTSGESKTSVDSSAAPKPSEPAAFTAFNVVEIMHDVKDYKIWKPVYQADSTEQKASGMTAMVIGRNNDNPNKLSVVLEVSDIEKAKAFGDNPRLKDAMTKSGVISKPELRWWKVTRFNPDAKEKTWFTVTHKVKDFDAWLKVYDAEGTAKREADGMNVAAVMRGIEDANLVQVVVDYKDMAKVKAGMASPEKKKVMQDAGVEGEPIVVFYTQGE